MLFDKVAVFKPVPSQKLQNTINDMKSKIREGCWWMSHKRTFISRDGSEEVTFKLSSGKLAYQFRERTSQEEGQACVN
jgi:hypothetical protein